MTKPILLTVNLPFAGFYGSEYSEAIDHEESQWLEYKTDSGNGETDDDYESAWPEPLRVADEMADLLFRHTTYRDAYRQIAHSYVDAFDYQAGEAFGESLTAKRQTFRMINGTYTPGVESYQRPSIGMSFESMDSPREYNFATDRVYGRIPLKFMRALLKRSSAENHATLARVVAERFTSRSGFSSFYDSDVAAWLAKAGPLQEWDHNELGTLLIAGLVMADVDLESGDRYDSFMGRVTESTLGDEGAYQAWSNAVDWTAFDAGRLEARAEKLADWMESEPDDAKAWIRENGARAAVLAEVEPSIDLDDESVIVRCPYTLDMFTAEADQ